MTSSFGNVVNSSTKLSNVVPGGVNLVNGFVSSVEKWPSRPALNVDSHEYTYQQLHDRALSIAATLLRNPASDAVPLTAVFAYRSLTAYSGVLAALLRGNGYVPLNRMFPPARTRTMLERSLSDQVVVDIESMQQLPQILDGLGRKMTIVCADCDVPKSLSEKFPQHRWIGASQLSLDGAPSSRTNVPDDIAYVLFTSGSTGIPKGVMVTHANSTAFIASMTARYGINCDDRFSQHSDQTFDLSVFDMFVCWSNGACLCSPNTKDVIKPGKFINEQRLTVWFSVPSIAMFLKQFGMMKPGSYKSLRWSLFCGEALPTEVATTWSEAAPNSVIENLYGPTELTVACTLYRFDKERTPNESEQGCVPIGEPYPGMTALVVDENLHEVQPGSTGELILTGTQLSRGYWHDPEKTSAAFVKIPGREEVFYRTGDLVRRPLAGLPLTYLGRIDNQLKIMGYRVEPGDIEMVLREESGADAAVALGWPKTPSGAGGIVGIVSSSKKDLESLKKAVVARLPHYMAPRAIHIVPQMPLNVNGKVDRKELLKMLENGTL